MRLPNRKNVHFVKRVNTESHTGGIKSIHIATKSEETTEKLDKLLSRAVIDGDITGYILALEGFFLNKQFTP